ncbi:MAG: hypothetical protein WC371_03425 [Parachlamydiales bacterium]|jgi:hypothetical protein
MGNKPLWGEQMGKAAIVALFFLCSSLLMTSCDVLDRTQEEMTEERVLSPVASKTEAKASSHYERRW